MCACQQGYFSPWCEYHSVPGKRPCSTFQGVNVTASIKTYENYILGKVSAHVGQNRELCLSTHGCLPRTLWYVNIVCSLVQPWTPPLPHMQRVLTEHWSPAVTILLTDALSRSTPSLSKTTDSNETVVLVQHNRVRANHY